MTLQLAVIASSVAGALFFFFGGYLIARSASSPLPGASTLEHPPSQAVRDGSAVSPIGSQSVADAVSATLELNALRVEVANCRNRLAVAEREQGRIAGLEEEVQQHLEKRHKLERENLQMQQKWKDKEREVGTLREEKSDLKRRLQQTLEEIKLSKEQTGRLNELEAERNQLTITLESLNRKVNVLERYQEENARLSNMVAEVPHLRKTVDELKQENRELRSLGLEYEPLDATTHEMPAEHLGGSMQDLIEQFAQSRGARGAALADDHGLLIAGTSKYAEGLALTSALCDGLMTQLVDILPLASLHQLVIVDTNAVTAAVHPFRAGSNQLTLATLSVGPRLGSKAIGDFVHEASRLIDGRPSQVG